jgi:hypothetical protein
MRWLLALVLGLLAFPAFAQCVTPPGPAAAAGLNTNVFCWGTADTISEIAPNGTTTYMPGTYKWYPYVNGAAGGTYSVNGSGGITISPSIDTSTWYFNTCASANTGQTFTGGPALSGTYYAEANLTWDETGHGAGVHMGFFAFTFLGGFPYTISQGYELDFPDNFAFGLETDQHLPSDNRLGPSSDGNDTISTGNTYGVLITPSSATYFRNGVNMGSATFTGGSSALDLSNGQMCAGPFMTDLTKSMTMNSYTVWQAGGGGPAAFGGSRGRR